jgi:hypothetical protein
MIAELMNPIEVMQVQIDLEKKGIKHYDMRPGNDCIWVSYGMIECYYIFRDGKIADVQID